MANSKWSEAIEEIIEIACRRVEQSIQFWHDKRMEQIRLESANMRKLEEKKFELKSRRFENGGQGDRNRRLRESNDYSHSS